MQVKSGSLLVAALLAFAAFVCVHCQDALPPSSPCPPLFTYEPYVSGSSIRWRGVIRLLAPPRFSSLHLSVLLAASEHLALPIQYSSATAAPEVCGGCPKAKTPGLAGSLGLRGGVQAARALVRGAPEQRRKAIIHFVADFPCGMATVPYLLNITVNGRELCLGSEDPVHMKSTISLVAALETGLKLGPGGEEDFEIPSQEDNKTVHLQQYGNESEPLPPLCEESPSPPPTGPFSDTGSTSSVSSLLPNPASTELPDIPNLLPPFAADTLPTSSPGPDPHSPSASTVSPVTTPSQSPAAVNEDKHEAECGRPWQSGSGSGSGPESQHHPYAFANPLVTRGAAAPRGRWPWLAALFKKVWRRDQLGLNFECGASLISKRHVLTAAHCVEVRSRRRKPVDAAELVVYLGKHDLLSYTEPGQRTVEVDSVRMHPAYTQALASAISYDADLALLVLSDVVSLTRFIRPVCLWNDADGGVDLATVVGKVGMVPGWGKDDTGALSNEVRVASMPIVSQETCLRSNVFYTTFTSDSTFCAGFKNGTSVCNGDSGGGLFVQASDGRWLLRGVVSVAMVKVNEQSCDAYNFVVFTDVAKFLPWIYEQMYSTCTV